MNKRKILSIVLITLIILTMVQPAFANVSDINDTVVKSKTFKDVSSKLEELGYKQKNQPIKSELVEALPNGKELDTPVERAIVPFTNQDKTVDLIYVKEGTEEYVAASVKMDKKESISMIKEMINKQYIEKFIKELGCEINYDDIAGSKKIVSDTTTNKTKEITSVATSLTKNNEDIGLITFIDDGTVIAFNFNDNKAYLLKNDGSLESKTRTKTSTDVTIQATEQCEGANCFWHDCMLRCLCNGNVSGQCVAIWTTWAVSCIACWCSGGTVIPSCITCLGGEGGLAYCFYDCW